MARTVVVIVVAAIVVGLQKDRGTVENVQTRVAGSQTVVAEVPEEQS